VFDFSFVEALRMKDCYRRRVPSRKRANRLTRLLKILSQYTTGLEGISG
jgi:hypothetical protein